MSELDIEMLHGMWVICERHDVRSTDRNQPCPLCEPTKQTDERQAFIREAAMRAMQGMGVNYVHAFEKCDAQACVMAAELLWDALQESEGK